MYRDNVVVAFSVPVIQSVEYRSYEPKVAGSRPARNTAPSYNSLVAQR